MSETKLDYQTLFPNSFEKQRVSLAVNVFNQKTVVALRKRGKHETATFVAHVTKTWEILNIKSPREAHKLNDPNRRKFEDLNDDRFEYLQQMATSFKLMDNSIRGKRVQGLTGETSNALHQTLIGIIDLIKTLLNLDHTYVLPSKFQSDRLEKEFGIYRQGSGGNFFISAEQVINSLQLERIRLFAKLDIHMNEISRNGCCSNKSLFDSDEGTDLLDACFLESSNITLTDRSVMYYIAVMLLRRKTSRGPMSQNSIVQTQNSHVSCQEVNLVYHHLSCLS